MTLTSPSQSGPGSRRRVASGVLIVTAVLGLSLAGARSAETSLFGTSYYGTSSDQASDVVAVDIDGDGVKDLAIASRYENYNGGWDVSAKTRPVGSTDEHDYKGWIDWPSGAVDPWAAFTFADLNHDGRPEYIGCIAGHAVLSVCSRRDDGRPVGQVYVEVGQDPVAIVTGDVDGDGNTDVVTGLFASRYSVARGRGDGSFHPPIFGAGQIWEDSGYPRTNPLALADFNLDGNLDLAAPGGILLGDGSGHLGEVRPFGPAGVFVVGDFDADGVPDIASIPAGRSELLVVRGNGDGSFSSMGQVSFQALPSDLAVDDLNEDGRPELVVGDVKGHVSVLTGNGNGTFAAPRSFRAGFPIAGIDVLDVDRDGHVDVAVAGGALAILKGNGDGSLDEVVPKSYGVGQSPVDVLIDDLNRDRHLDIITANQSSLSVLLGHGNGTFAPSMELPVGGRPTALFTADLNVDGVRDLVLFDDLSGGVAALLGRGNGSFSPAIAGPNDLVAVVGVRELSEDGIPDLLVRNKIPPDPSDYIPRDGLAISIGRGDGTFEAPRTLDNPPRGTLRLAELNRDGSPDLVLLSNHLSPEGDDLLWLYQGLSSGAGAFTWRQVWSRDERWGSVSGLQVADLNRDFRDDVLFGKLERGGTYDPDICVVRSVLTGSNGIEFKAEVVHRTPPTRHFTTGDYNGDGHRDVAFTRVPPAGWVWPNWEDGGPVGVTVALGMGNGQLAPEGEYSAGSQPAALASGDLDDDGKPDLVVVDSQRHEVRILLNQGPQSSPPPSPDEVVVLPGEASVTVRWRPVLDSRLTGYRVYYGIAGTDPNLQGSFAAEGPSGVLVPADASSLTLHCVAGQRIAVAVSAVGHDGRESPASYTAAAGSVPLGGDIEVWPKHLNPKSAGRWATVTIELHAGYQARNIDPALVRLNQTVEGEVQGLVDRDHDGIEELQVRFPRAAVGSGEPVVTGVVGGCSGPIAFTAGQSASVADGPQAVSGGGTEFQEAMEEELDPSPTALLLRAPWPNPARTECDIAFDLPRSEHVRIAIFDVRGRSVARLVDARMPSGRHVVRWSTAEVPAGLYLVRMEADTFRQVRKLAVTR